MPRKQRSPTRSARTGAGWLRYLIRVTGNWDLAEECAQDAFERALERWPRDGIPSSPAAWLKTTARNRALDRLRRATVGEAKLKELMMLRTE